MTLLWLQTYIYDVKSLLEVEIDTRKKQIVSDLSFKVFTLLLSLIKKISSDRFSLLYKVTCVFKKMKNLTACVSENKLKIVHDAIDGRSTR